MFGMGEEDLLLRSSAARTSLFSSSRVASRLIGARDLEGGLSMGLAEEWRWTAVKQIDRKHSQEKLGQQKACPCEEEM
jgi:hypothetical protein